MLDVHILLSLSTPEEYVQECVSSAWLAASVASYPVAVHILAGEVGHIGKGRRKGYSLGEHKYKTYIDDDDYVEQNAFACLLPALEQNPAAAFTGEKLAQNGYLTERSNRHHLAVYRKDVLAEFDFDRWPCCGDVATARLAEKHEDGVIDIPAYPYIHRVYASSKARMLRKQYPHELGEAQYG